MTEIWKLDCVKCGTIVEYASKRGILIARKNKTPCPACRGKQPRSRIISNTQWNRICPSCKQIKYYSSKRNWDRAVKTNSHCPQCHPGPDQKTIKKIIDHMKGKKYPTRASNERKTKELKYFRVCPNCKNEIGYVHEYSRDRANKSNTICNRCSNYVYKKTWNYVIKDDHIKKMAAKKAGYNSFADYMADLDHKKQYYREVRRITRQQPIHMLEHYGELMGRCGTPGAYQLDHIISIDKGYQEKRPASQIGHISNLRIISWEENRHKWNV